MKSARLPLVLLIAVWISAPAFAQTAKPKPKSKGAAHSREPWPEPKEPENLKKVEARDLDGAIHRGRAILLADQESLDGKNGPRAEWPYEGVYRVAGQIPVGYRIGGTCICAMALLDASGKEVDAETRAAVDRALEFVLAKLDDPLMTTDFSGTYDTRGWGHAYALSFLLRLRELQLVPEKRKTDVDARIKTLTQMLQDTQLGERGGWNYARGDGEKSAPSTFMTAPTLQILFEARHQGEAVDAQMIERGLKTLEDARLDTGAFQYGTNPARKSGKGIEEVAGSTGRSPICETTLFLAGRGSVERIQAAVDAFFAHWRWLEQRRAQSLTHEGPYKIAPYFFFYAHRFVAQAIEMLPDEKRDGYRQKLYELLWHVREDDGGWNDRVFPRSENYGTAMTLLALGEPHARRPAGWSDAKPESSGGGTGK